MHGITAGGFVQNVEMAYRYGRRGMTMEDVQKHTAGKGMSSEALQAAYDAGMEQGKAEANTAQTAVDDAKGTETVKHGSVQMLHAEATKNTADDGGVKYQARRNKNNRASAASL